MTSRDPADPSDDHRSKRSLEPATAVVFTAGFVMVSYGVFFLLADGSVVKGLAWTGVGLLTQTASGVVYPQRVERTGLVNPFAVFIQVLRRVRNRVRSWDERE